MEISMRAAGGRRVLHLAGRFDAHEAAGFRAALEPLLAGPAPVVGVDLGDVVFLDSSALSELVRGMKRARSAGGDLVLVRLSAPARVILELTGLHRALTVEDTPVGSAP
jgi:anti-sigma B factor antagonist